MMAFLQAYGIYLALGLLMLVMVVQRGKGGCGGGGHSRGDEKGKDDGTQQPGGLLSLLTRRAEFRALARG